MNLSWKIFTIFRIPVKLHFTMLLLPFISYGRMPIEGLFGFIIWLLVIFLLFGSVLLHELGHSLVGRRFGVLTKDIILTPIGGMARITSNPRTPLHEILMAAAGPAVSAILAILSFMALSVFHAAQFTPVFLRGFEILFWVNAMLGAFNLIPALPMDGGRVLRGLLSLKYDYVTATRKAARTGQVIAVTAGLYSILFLGNFNLLIISVFIYFAAGAELKMARMQEYRKKMNEVGYDYQNQNPFFIREVFKNHDNFERGTNTTNMGSEWNKGPVDRREKIPAKNVKVEIIPNKPK